VIKEDVGTAAKEEWREDKEIRASESAGRRQKEHSVAARLRSRRGSVCAADRISSLEIIHEEEETPRVRRQKHSKKRFISSSPPPPEIPETQQEISSLERGEISIDIYRPVGFDSQDWSSLRGSQLARVTPSQNTVSSKDTTEGDSTLGSSLPPDSPIQAEVQSSAPQVEAASSLVIQPYFPSGSESVRNSGPSAPLYNQSISSGVDLPCVRHDAHADQQPNLLVVRSDSLGNPSTGPSRPAEVQAEHASNSPPSSPLFVTDEEGSDLRPIAEPGRSREENPTEGELEFLPVASSRVRPSIQDSVRLRATNSEQRSVVTSVRVQRSQSESSFTAQILNARQPEAEHEGRPQLFSKPIKTVPGTSTRLLDTASTKSPTSTTSRRFYSQYSFPETPTSGVQSLKANPRVNTPRNSELASSSHSQHFAAQSRPQSLLQTTLSAAHNLKHTSPLKHCTSPPHHLVSSGALIHPSIEYNMPNSHRESSPRVRKPPSGPPETPPELGLREKLRQIRATSRANQDARSRSQANTGHAKSPATKTPETRFSRQVSPEKNTESSTTDSAATQDQPIPSLENADGHAGEMEVEKVDNEPALSSSLAPPPPVLNLSLGKSLMPTQVNDVDKAISELDIPTMPLLHPAEFVVPLPIDGRIKHQYDAELTSRYKEIADFLNSPRSLRLIGAMNGMIRQLNDTVIHTDLGLNGPATQVVPSSQEALWAEDASSKFAFLGEMINLLRGSNHHVVVTAGSGPKLDLLHNYLIGKGVNCRRHFDFGTTTARETSRSADQMMYTLISTQNGALKELPRSSSLLIAFDDSLDAAILPEWCSTERFVPVLLLLVVNSAEHVGRCIPKDVPEPERLRRLIKAAVHVHKQLGEMPFHSDFRQAFNLDQGGRLALVKKDLGAKIAYAATKTAEALSSQNFALNFTLRPISELDLSGLEDYPPSTEESKGVSSSGSRAGTPGAQKRLRVSRSQAPATCANQNTG
jgi:Class II histone deacetylase complex subunits 2 and 3